MTKALIKTQIRLQQLNAKREAGQGSLEYVGMMIVAAVVVVALITFFGGANGAGKLGSLFSDAVNNVTTGAKPKP